MPQISIPSNDRQLRTSSEAMSSSSSCGLTRVIVLDAPDFQIHHRDVPRVAGSDGAKGHAAPISARAQRKDDGARAQHLGLPFQVDSEDRLLEHALAAAAGGLVRNEQKRLARGLPRDLSYPGIGSGEGARLASRGAHYMESRGRDHPRNAAGRRERDEAAVGREARLEVHPIAADEDRRTPAVGGNGIEPRAPVLEVLPGRGGGVDETPAIRGPVEARNVVLERRDDLRGREGKVLDEESGRPPRFPGAYDERFLLFFARFFRGLRLRGQVRDAARILRPFVARGAGRRRGQCPRLPAPRVHRHYLGQVGNEGEKRQELTVRGPSKLGTRERPVEDSRGICETPGLASRSRDHVQRGYMLVLLDGRLGERVHDPFSVGREAHVDDGSNRHQIVERDRFRRDNLRAQRERASQKELSHHRDRRTGKNQRAPIALRALLPQHGREMEDLDEKR